MAEPVVTKEVWQRVLKMGSTPERVTRELKALMTSEPILWAQLMRGTEGLCELLGSHGAPTDATDVVRVEMTRIAAQLLLALRLGHYRLWEKITGFSQSLGSPEDKCRDRHQPPRTSSEPGEEAGS